MPSSSLQQIDDERLSGWRSQDRKEKFADYSWCLKDITFTKSYYNKSDHLSIHCMRAAEPDFVLTSTFHWSSSREVVPQSYSFAPFLSNSDIEMVEEISLFSCKNGRIDSSSDKPIRLRICQQR